LGVIGAFGGAHFVITSFLYGAVLGGIVSLFILIRRKALTAVLKNLFCHLPIQIQSIILRVYKNPTPINAAQQAACQEKFPYGLVLIAGTVIAYLFPLGW
jgi:prepilin peptidase CpaA